MLDTPLSWQAAPYTSTTLATADWELSKKGEEIVV